MLQRTDIINTIGMFQRMENKDTADVFKKKIDIEVKMVLIARSTCRHYLIAQKYNVNYFSQIYR